MNKQVTIDGKLYDLVESKPKEKVYSSGDVLRSRSNKGLVALSDKGWISLNTGRFHSWETTGFKQGFFTEKGFAKVNLR